MQPCLLAGHQAAVRLPAWGHQDGAQVHPHCHLAAVPASVTHMHVRSMGGHSHADGPETHKVCPGRQPCFFCCFFCSRVWTWTTQHRQINASQTVSRRRTQTLKFRMNFWSFYCGVSQGKDIRKYFCSCLIIKCATLWYFSLLLTLCYHIALNYRVFLWTNWL